MQQKEKEIARLKEELKKKSQKVDKKKG